jgi:hypothetical protein
LAIFSPVFEETLHSSSLLMLDANEPKIKEGVEWGILKSLEKHCPATVSAQ